MVVFIDDFPNWRGTDGKLKTGGAGAEPEPCCCCCCCDILIVIDIFDEKKGRRVVEVAAVV